MGAKVNLVSTLLVKRVLENRKKPEARSGPLSLAFDSCAMVFATTTSYVCGLGMIGGWSLISISEHNKRTKSSFFSIWVLLPLNCSRMLLPLFRVLYDGPSCWLP